MYADLLVDPSRCGSVSIEATDLLVHKRKIDTTLALTIWQAGCVGDVGFKAAGFDGRNIPVLIAYLKKFYGPSQRVVVYEAAQYAVCDPVIRATTIGGLGKVHLTGLSTLFIPPAKRPPLDSAMLKRLGLKRASEAPARKRQRPKSGKK